jgi:hypothetical protein
MRGITPFNEYATGVRRYGLEGRDNPNGGMVDPMGYKERDAKHRARKNAIMNRLKAKKQGRLFSSENLGEVKG